MTRNLSLFPMPTPSGSRIPCIPGRNVPSSCCVFPVLHHQGAASIRQLSASKQVTYPCHGYKAKKNSGIWANNYYGPDIHYLASKFALVSLRSPSFPSPFFH